jgi:3-methyl-2-oxobutanoate hydroxymethyltransferase
MKNRNEKISMLTGYDFSMAKIIDSSGIDIILVGDSASNVMAGHETTLPITLDQMIYHASSVVRGVKRALVVVDLPFGSYQSDPNEALRSAIRIMKESGAHAVKMEGGIERLINDAKILDELGCFGIVLEKIPASVSKKVTKAVKVPVIGIGAGSYVDGQVLVTHDLVGLSTEFNPRFLRRYIDLNHLMSDAIKKYIEDVKNLNFPSKNEQY